MKVRKYKRKTNRVIKNIYGNPIITPVIRSQRLRCRGNVEKG